MTVQRRYANAKSNQEKQDEIKSLTEKLQEGVKNIFNNPDKSNGFDVEKYKEYLAAASKFHNYSLNNCILIAMQNPNATLVAGYKTWQNNWDRHVKKGEKGLRILAPNPYTIKKEQDKIDPQTKQPVLDASGKTIKEEVEIQVQGFRAISVFDVSQTEGKELPKILSHGYGKELEGNVQEYEKFMGALKEISPLPIEFETIYGGAKGYTRFGDKIAINTDMSQVQNCKTGIHEVAHAMLHENSDADKYTKEVQAESVAYIVCQHYGIETSDYSFGYVAGWSSDKDLKELTASMDVIRKTADTLITSIDGKLQEYERSAERTDNEVAPTKIEISPTSIKQNPGAELSC